MLTFTEMIRLLLFVVVLVLAVQANAANGHFFGSTRTIDNYQIVFSPYPSTPKAGDNSTLLNFSVLENNSNIYNIYAAVVITEKQSGNIVEQIPYKLYEFSDFTVPFTFSKPGDYTVRLQARVLGDEKYQANQLVASFDISALDPNQLIPFDELMLFYVTPAAVVIAGIAIYLRSKKKL
ncbi:MAG TPA: hypothetical protein VGQ13_07915 [Nitrososphaera sp.]|jgi:hypothetical protein|nr:hypothetical protein [Nitrososphaera sp.]